MSKDKLGQESAFPCFEPNASGIGNSIQLNIDGSTQYIPFEVGMSKRFYAACAAMQGILSNSTLKMNLGVDGEDNETLGLVSYAIADELLKQEKL